MSEEDNGLNQGDSTPTDNGQSVKVGEGGGEQPEETVTLKKSEHEKILSDLENYKTGLLNLKAKRGLEIEPDGQGSNKPSADGQGAKKEIDTTEVAKNAASIVMGDIGKSNENKAKVKFLADHADYLDDSQWSQLVSHFASKRGKATVDDILEDMEDAVLSHKRATGKLQDYLKQIEERGRRAGELNATVNRAGSAGGIGDNTIPPKDRTLEVTPQQADIASRFGHDPKEVVKVKLTEGGITIPPVKSKK